MAHVATDVAASFWARALLALVEAVDDGIERLRSHRLRPGTRQSPSSAGERIRRRAVFAAAKAGSPGRNVAEQPDMTAWLCVSRGVGLERLHAPRIRFLCPPELVVFDLLAP